MAVRALDRAVLVRDAGVVAGRRHAVVAHQPLVALRQVLLGVAVEVAERRRQAVAAMLRGTPPSAHSAFCRPSASATKLSPPSTTWACSKPEKASRK